MTRQRYTPRQEYFARARIFGGFDEDGAEIWTEKGIRRSVWRKVLKKIRAGEELDPKRAHELWEEVPPGELLLEQLRRDGIELVA